jgi:hypothetical protein
MSGWGTPMAHRLAENSPDGCQAIDQIIVWIKMVSHRLEKEFSLEWLQAALGRGLREGRQPLTNLAIYAAEASTPDELCDAELRTVFAEMVGGMFPPERRGPGHLQIWAYGQRAVQRAPLERPPRGHRWHDDWMRNIQLSVLIILTCQEFPVPPTRDPKCTSNASGISLVVAAFDRLGLPCPREESVQRNIWLGLPGELVRSALPALISERRIFEQTLERACNEVVNRRTITAQPQALAPLRRRLLNGASSTALVRGASWALPTAARSQK